MCGQTNYTGKTDMLTAVWKDVQTNYNDKQVALKAVCSHADTKLVRRKLLQQ